jgi:hypothetical protein
MGRIAAVGDFRAKGSENVRQELGGRKFGQENGYL